MTKRRAIYGSAATSLSLARCSLEAQLLFDRLITAADDQGRLQGDPLLVKAACMPLIDRASVAKVDRWLDELYRQAMVIRYEAMGQPLVQIVKWWDYQDWMRHSYASRWPAPDGWADVLKGGGNPPSPDGETAAKGRQDAGATTAERGRDAGLSESESGDSGGVEVESLQEASISGAESETPPPADLFLKKALTTHYDLTHTKASPGGVQMYRDLLRDFGFELVNRAQWNVGATDKADRGFIGRVKTQCRKLRAA